jgi:hypothetical protein
VHYLLSGKVILVVSGIGRAFSSHVITLLAESSRILVAIPNILCFGLEPYMDDEENLPKDPEPRTSMDPSPQGFRPWFRN